MAKVIVDSREQNHDVIEGLIANGIHVIVKQLAVGDYIASDRVCIERKTVSDFESSLIDGRLFEQISRMKEYYEFPILLIEGTDEFRLKKNTISGTIAYLYIEHKIISIMSSSGSDTASIIASIAKREQQSHDREPSLKGGARLYTQKQFQESIIGNIPGIGPKLAKSLLKHFGSISSIANASTEELLKVDKIGRKKAELINRTLNEIYEP